MFAQSALYRDAVGLGGAGLDMEEVDRQTSEIIQIMKGGDSGRSGPASTGDAGGKDQGKA